MANKFQKSVLERLEQEQQKSKLNQKLATAPLERTPTEEKDITLPVPSQSVLDIETAEPSRGLLEYLRLEPVRYAKNKTFYLDVSVIDAVRVAAKRAGVTDSKLVNDILMTVLDLREEG